MFQKSGFTLLAVLVAAGSLTGSAFAKGGGGGGGGGGATVVLPPPPIPASTFDGIGPGPTYIHESFGHTQRTRYKQDGTVVDVVNKPEINGIRAEYPNNKTESWNGGFTGILKWTFHTDGLSGTTLSGTYNMSPNGFNRLAVSYDPVDHVAAATIDGNLVASVPYTAASIKYAGVEGTFNGNVDNFTVRSGTV